MDKNNLYCSFCGNAVDNNSVRVDGKCDRCNTVVLESELKSAEGDSNG